MLDLNRVEYRVTCVSSDGKQLDLTPISTGLGWSEGAKELAAKITLKVAICEIDGKNITELVKPFTQIIVFADTDNGDGFVEVCRGKIQKITFSESHGEFYLDIEAADEANELRHNQANFFFTDGHNSSAIIKEVLSKFGVDGKIDVVDVKHSKKVYRKKYLCDIIEDVLKDIREAGKGEFFIRATGGKIEIIKRGDNSTVWHFDIDENILKVSETFDASKLVTKVKVVGKSKDEGHPAIEQTVNGKTEYGERAIIYERPNNETSGDAEKAAQKILKEQGDIKRNVRIESPDVPTLRKGDKIRVRSSLGTSFYFVKSVNHNAVTRKMNCELDYAKDDDKLLLNQVFSLAEGTGTDSSEPY